MPPFTVINDMPSWSASSCLLTRLKLVLTRAERISIIENSGLKTITNGAQRFNVSKPVSTASVDAAATGYRNRVVKSVDVRSLVRESLNSDQARSMASLSS